MLTFVTTFQRMLANHTKANVVAGKIADIGKKLHGKLTVRHDSWTHKDEVQFEDLQAGFGFSLIPAKTNAGLFIDSIVFHDRSGKDVATPTPTMLQRAKSVLTSLQESGISNPAILHQAAKAKNSFLRLFH